MASGEHRPGQVLDSYLLRSLAVAGYAPSFEHCARCGLEGPHRWFNPSMGGMLCTDLPGPRLGEPRRRRRSRVLGALLAGDWPVVEAADAAPPARRPARLVSAYLAWHLERALRSLELRRALTPDRPLVEVRERQRRASDPVTSPESGGRGSRPVHRHVSVRDRAPVRRRPSRDRRPPPLEVGVRQLAPGRRTWPRPPRGEDYVRDSPRSAGTSGERDEARARLVQRLAAARVLVHDDVVAGHQQRERRVGGAVQGRVGLAGHRSSMPHRPGPAGTP